MKTMKITEYHDALKSQGAKTPLDCVVVCPMCKTLQSPRDLIRAGAGEDFDAVQKYIGFSCIGRFTNAGPPSAKTPGAGCDWTLGGLFRLHTLEVIMEDGTTSPAFEPATPEEARAHNRYLEVA